MLRCDKSSNYDLELIMEFHPLMLSTKQSVYAANIIREAFDFHLNHFSGPSQQGQKLQNTLRLEHIVLLVDLLLQFDKLEEAVVVIRRGQRWLQGRIMQTSWDSIDDDREYDPPGVSRYKEGQPEEEFEGFALDPNLRHRLALTRLRLGDDNEATVCLCRHEPAKCFPVDSHRRGHEFRRHTAPGVFS